MLQEVQEDQEGAIYHLTENMVQEVGAVRGGQGLDKVAVIIHNNNIIKQAVTQMVYFKTLVKTP